MVLPGKIDNGDMLLSDLIKVYDNVLPTSACLSLTNFFDKQEKVSRKSSIASFTEINLNNLPSAKNYLNELVKLQISLFKQYESELPEKFKLPPLKLFEEFRLKCYNKNDIFDWHCDVADITSAKRYLAFLWYLSDVEDNSGKTTFFNNLKIKPKQGSVVVFPPMWMFPHKGDLVTSKKYIMSSYCNF